MSDWLRVHQGESPLLVAIPHTGTHIPDAIAPTLNSMWLARKDADWRIEDLYDFAADLGATTVCTQVSRTVIDVNRDPSGLSLYPGMATTELCPTTTFDGEPLYRLAPPDAEEIAQRRETYFKPYHQAIGQEIERLRARYGVVVLYDAHAIRSRIPRLFDGELPHFNIGSNSGVACAPSLVEAIELICAQAHGFSHVRDGRFRGGYATRHYGRPETGVHAIQMELALRAFVEEPAEISEHNWPPLYSPSYAAPARAVLERILRACLAFAMDQT